MCKIGMPHKLTFQSTPCVRATSGDYLVNRRTAVVNPTAKACFCQSSHSATGLLILVSVFSPLDFSRIVCYHRFSSVSALRWVVSAVFGRRGTYSLIFFSSKISIIPFLTASVFVSLLSLQYCKSFKFVFTSIRIFRLMDLGLSIFGLPVRGLTKSPHFLCTTKYSIHYVFQKVNCHLPQSFLFVFVGFASTAL